MHTCLAPADPCSLVQGPPFGTTGWCGRSDAPGCARIFALVETSGSFPERRAIPFLACQAQAQAQAPHQHHTSTKQHQAAPAPAPQALAWVRGVEGKERSCVPQAKVNEPNPIQNRRFAFRNLSFHPSFPPIFATALPPTRRSSTSGHRSHTRLKITAINNS